MSVRAKVALTDPESTAVTLQVSMTVAEWRVVHEALEDNKRYEPSQLKYAITSAISKALAAFTESIDDAREQR